MAASGGIYAPIGDDQNLFANTDRTIKLLTVDEDGQPVDTSGFTREWILYLNGAVALTVPESAISQENGNGTNDRVLIPWTATGTTYDNDTLAASTRYTHKLWKIDAGSREVMSFGPVVVKV